MLSVEEDIGGLSPFMGPDIWTKLALSSAGDENRHSRALTGHSPEHGSRAAGTPAPASTYSGAVALSRIGRGPFPGTIQAVVAIDLIEFTGG
jgi:hypothetical protein